MTINSVSIGTLTTSYQMTSNNVTDEPCIQYDVVIKTWFEFGTLNLVRVIITWVLFVFSLVGNSFVIWALRRSKMRHFVMFHLALSNLIYTTFVMPIDAMWNTTMHWLAGEAGCRICQMMKQFGMYASSFMVVVIALDKVTAILCTISCDGQRRRGVVMVITAWCASLLCCIPAGILFSQASITTCEGKVLYQCVDFLVVTGMHDRAPYYFFTMFISFVLPLLVTVVSYSLIVYEISNMKERDRVLMGRKNSVNSASMQKAKRKTVTMKVCIMMSFLICWGPYYGKGIYDWFQPNVDQPPKATEVMMYIAMYLNPVLHPFVFGVFMKEIRTKFYAFGNVLRNTIFKSKPRMSFSPRNSFSTTATGATSIQFNSRMSYNISVKMISSPLKKNLIM